jgi:hypothetical protein
MAAQTNTVTNAKMKAAVVALMGHILLDRQLLNRQRRNCGGDLLSGTNLFFRRSAVVSTAATRSSTRSGSLSTALDAKVLRSLVEIPRRLIVFIWSALEPSVVWMTMRHFFDCSA